jgi:hypothetical protein
LVLDEVDGLSLFEANKLQFERSFYFSEREDIGFLPDEIFLLCGGFAVPLGIIIGEPAVDGSLEGDIFELCLPEGDDELLLHNKYIDRYL